MKPRIAVIMVSLLVGCVSAKVAPNRTPSGLFEEQNLLAAAILKADVALCKTGPSNLSINERKQALHEAIQTLERIATSDKASVNSTLEELRFYERKSETEDDFWRSGSTCSRQLLYPKVEVGETASELLEAFERALSYRNIALCAHGRGDYAIKDRIGFLDAAVRIFRSIASDPRREMAAKAGLEARYLEPLEDRAHSNDFAFWSAATTCPRK